MEIFLYLAICLIAFVIPTRKSMDYAHIFTGDFYIEAGSNQLDETDECKVYIQIVNAKMKNIMYFADIPAYIPVVNAEEPNIAGQPQGAEYEQGKHRTLCQLLLEYQTENLSYQWYKESNSQYRLT